MALHSMTGFGHADGAAEGLGWRVELKSVNNRGLEIRCRLPAMMEAWEAAIREGLGRFIDRGMVNLSLVLGQGSEAGTLSINQAALKQYLSVAKALARDHGLEPPGASDLLALRGVVDFTAAVLDEAALARLQQAVLASIEEAARALNASRAGEGARLGAALGALIARIEALVGKAEAFAARQPALARQRLEDTLARLQVEHGALDPDRLAQEVALMAAKADVREELDRLGAHVAAARALLDGGSPMGRAFEFLTQEFMREANTLCSKSVDGDLTRVGLDLKAAIEQVREQIKNLE